MTTRMEGKFYKLPATSELERTLKDICLAFESGATKIEFAGTDHSSRVSNRGTKYFSIRAGLPVQVAAFESKREGGGNLIVVDLPVIHMENSDTKITEKKVRLRGQTKLDKNGNPVVYFFDPYEEGVNRGVLEGKLELVRKGLVKPEEAFSDGELGVHIKAGHISEKEVKELEYGTKE